MRLFYIDESGNTGTKHDVNEPIHWLAAVGISASAVKAIENQMLSLALKYFPGRARRPDFEFHGSDLFSGRGECNGIAPAQRIKVYEEMMQLLSNYDCVLFIRGIDKQLHQQRAREKSYIPEHPHQLASRYLFERIDEWLQNQQVNGQEPLYGLLVADEQKEVERDAVKNFASWREWGTQRGYRARNIDFLIDTIHYVPSQDSWLIQLADCVVFLRNRYEKILRKKGADISTYTDSEQVIIHLWQDKCYCCVKNDLVWPPQ